MMASLNIDGVSKIVAKLQKRLNDHEYYEAHQLYRTLCFRYCAQEKYDKAIDLLMNGALALLEANQSFTENTIPGTVLPQKSQETFSTNLKSYLLDLTSSGADLAVLLVTTLEKANVPVTNDIIMKLAALHRLMPEDNIERPNYVSTVLRWAEKNPPSLVSSSSSSSASEVSASSSLAACSLLHNEFGVTYWNERNFARARFHFIRSQNGEGCASMLIEFHVTYGYPSEVDLFITQAVLQFLCLRNRLTAEACFNSYTRQHPQVEKGPPFVRPLLNFLWLLLLATEGGSLAVFNILCEKYKMSLSRDPAYSDYLTRIGQLFFHLPIPKPPAGGGLFGGLFSNLLNMDEDVDDGRLLDDHCPVDLD